MRGHSKKGVHHTVAMGALVMLVTRSEKHTQHNVILRMCLCLFAEILYVYIHCELKKNT